MKFRVEHAGRVMAVPTIVVLVSVGPVSTVDAAWDSGARTARRWKPAFVSRMVEAGRFYGYVHAALSTGDKGNISSPLRAIGHALRAGVETMGILNELSLGFRDEPASFARHLTAAPRGIHVGGSDARRAVEVTPRPQDLQYIDTPLSVSIGIRGDGSRGSPYAYRSAVAVSAHYGAVDLWLRVRPLNLSVVAAPREPRGPDREVYIQLGAFVLRATRDGVIAEDGAFTRFEMPSSD